MKRQNNFWQQGSITSLKKTTSCSSEDPKDSAPRRKVTVCEQESSFVDIKHNLFVIFRAIHIFAKLGLYCAPD
jgi:hypothetical protein